MKRRAALAAVIVAVVGVAGWLLLREGRAGEAALEASGTVEATDADLAFGVPGRIARIGPEEGDEVAAGQELAALESGALEAKLESARSSLAGARARLRELERGSRPQELARARAALTAAREREEDARREAERARRLHEGGAVSRQARDRAVTALEVATAQRDEAEQALALVREGPRAETVEAQRAAVAAAEAAVDAARSALDDAVVTAPFAGRVTVRHRQPGEVVGAGAPVLTLLDPDDRWVRIYVPEDRIGRVEVGQAAEIRSDTWPDRAYEGRVTFLGDEAEFTPRNVQTPEERTRLVYPVKVRITGDPAFELKPGVPADVRLRGGTEGGDAERAPSGQAP